MLPFLTISEGEKKEKTRTLNDAPAVLALVDVERSYIFVGCTCSLDGFWNNIPDMGSFCSWKCIP